MTKTVTLTIKLTDNTINNLSDGGSSEYDGCIFSYGKLTIEGNGTLNVNGKQETKKIANLYNYEGLKRVPIQEAQAGDIVLISETLLFLY